ncbi:hypothetical protein K431DRAFT_135498 [Polychaeton citri CBS 116435]|uniref:Uncharacterized protein n=1 Tax=Polychaeton citri CBS 116435 TaxID=1314669 RepID=A0A9P4Q5E5_9PEZI|nr:hypothetical protein K431DRAFT_135498 [Polychaeton citri CBS 116435]
MCEGNLPLTHAESLLCAFSPPPPLLFCFTAGATLAYVPRNRCGEACIICRAQTVPRVRLLSHSSVPVHPVLYCRPTSWVDLRRVHPTQLLFRIEEIQGWDGWMGGWMDGRNVTTISGAALWGRCSSFPPIHYSCHARSCHVMAAKKRGRSLSAVRVLLFALVARLCSPGPSFSLTRRSRQGRYT